MLPRYDDAPAGSVFKGLVAVAGVEAVGNGGRIDRRTSCRPRSRTSSFTSLEPDLAQGGVAARVDLWTRDAEGPLDLRD